MCRFLRLKTAFPPRDIPARRTRGAGTWFGGVGRAQTRAGKPIGSRRAGGARGLRSRASLVCRTSAGVMSRCGWRNATRSARRCRGRCEGITRGDKDHDRIDRESPEWASRGRRADVLGMRRRHIEGGRISVANQKNGEPLLIPIHADLAAVLDREATYRRRRLTQVRQCPAPRPASVSPSSRAMRRAMRAAGFDDLRMVIEKPDGTKVSIIPGEDRQLMRPTKSPG